MIAASRGVTKDDSSLPSWGMTLSIRKQSTTERPAFLTPRSLPASIRSRYKQTANCMKKTEHEALFRDCHLTTVKHLTHEKTSRFEALQSAGKPLCFVRFPFTYQRYPFPCVGVFSTTKQEDPGKGYNPDLSAGSSTLRESVFTWVLKAISNS